MRKLFFLCLLMPVIFTGCETLSSSMSLSVCPIQATPVLDYAKNVDYTLSGYNISNYSSCTVCFRRISGGHEKGYSQIIDTRENPNTYQTYHTYQKLQYDEDGVKVKWIELTDRNSGKTQKYVNYH